ncbi:MAG: hypothetical protein V4505_07300 [Pseudomonadota bacterium]
MQRNMLLRGVGCVAIGAAVLVAPGFIPAPDLRAMVAGSAYVGWFAMALGVGMVAWHFYQRKAGSGRRR